MKQGAFCIDSPACYFPREDGRSCPGEHGNVLTFNQVIELQPHMSHAIPSSWTIEPLNACTLQGKSLP
eukprot:1154317-Pelagomonas_calceolata.AAC.3